MKKILFILTIAFSFTVNAQSINDDKTSITNFIKRMYNSAPFEGVKVIDDYDHQYFISVLSLEKGKYPNESMMNRVAQVKGQSQANIFFIFLQKLSFFSIKIRSFAYPFEVISFALSTSMLKSSKTFAIYAKSPF